jgi:hypothetical protein
MNILRLIKKSNLQPKLGRWGVTYEEHILDKRINWANHDHCGSEICEKFFDDKDKEKKEKGKQKVKKNVKGDEQDMEYYLPYCL